MATNQYPAFEGGQTLTAADLNQVREFLHQRDRMVARMVGFGINCGLGGSVATNTTLTLKPGLAIDQVGEPLLLPTQVTIPLPPTPSNDVFAFVDATKGGFSVVLEATDTVTVPPDCGQVGCEGHAELHTRSVALRVVAGQVTGPRFQFADEALLKVAPMQLSITSNPQGSFVTLRDALKDRLQGKINETLRTKLAAVKIDPSDLPGEKGFKAGWLNQVLFAALDLLRCEALMAIACDRTTPRPGVVLGWLLQNSGVWEWHCEFRHAWEPPVGFTQALMGGTCTDPSKVYRDALEAVISNYVEPEPPPTPPATDPDPDIFILCPKGMTRVGKKCVYVHEPALKYPDKWAELWEELDPKVPIWNPPVRTNPSDVYQDDPLEYLDSGIINVINVLGLNATRVQGALTNFVKDMGNEPNVVLASQNDLVKINGYTPGSSVSPADTVVLVKDSTDRVIATGRVPAAVTARAVGTQLPAAVGKADEALSTTKGLAEDIHDMDLQFGQMQGNVTNLLTFQQEFGTWQTGVNTSLAGVNTTVEQAVEAKFGPELREVQRQVAKVEGSIDVLKVGGGRASFASGGLTMDRQFAQGMVEYAETLTHGLESLVNDQNRNRLGRYVGDATRASAKLELALAEDEPVAIQAAALEVLDTMRTAIKSAGIEPDLARQVDAQFRMMRDITQ